MKRYSASKFQAGVYHFNYYGCDWEVTLSDEFNGTEHNVTVQKLKCLHSNSNLPAYKALTDYLFGDLLYGDLKLQYAGLKKVS